MILASFLKNRIRNRAKKLRENISKVDRKRWSSQISDHLLGMPEMQDAQTVMLYRALPAEVNVDGLFGYLWAASKRCLAPRVVPAETRMQAHDVTDLTAEFEPGFKGIVEPMETCPVVPVHDIDVILVPGTSFDPQGHRLGSGSGHYDRFMAQDGFHAVKIGVAYTFQILKEVPQEDHDLKVDWLVTEQHVIDCRTGKPVEETTSGPEGQAGSSES